MRTSSTRQHLCLLSTLLVVVLTGCTVGAGNDAAETAGVAPSIPTTPTAEGATTDSTAAEPVSTHAAFIAKLDHLCRRGNRLLEPYKRRYATTLDRGDYDQAANVFKAALRLDDPFYAKVAALDVPPVDARGLESYLHLSRQLDALGERVVRALRQRDEAELRRLRELGDRVQNRRTLVIASLGLTECGS